MNAVFPGKFDERFFAFDPFKAALNWMEPGMDFVRFTSLSPLTESHNIVSAFV
ncbi:hypothetical protein [Hydrogenibacillus schlegelii]|uniref:hypothetical protein n=1 Tax=Hydrogenibacillus schlegelii TaxID=1484 RepID=UPI002357F6D0|nr:hypothetical protein [Hydrogenibacillus schlegelii]